MRNGTTGRIINVNPGTSDDGDTIELDTVGGALTVPRRVFDRPGGGLDLSYAVTSYAVQGSTRDISTSVATGATSRRELYVDMTRGRHDNKVFGTINAPPGRHGRTPPDPAPPSRRRPHHRRAQTDTAPCRRRPRGAHRRAQTTGSHSRRPSRRRTPRRAWATRHDRAGRRDYPPTRRASPAGTVGRPARTDPSLTAPRPPLPRPRRQPRRPGRRHQRAT